MKRDRVMIDLNEVRFSELCAPLPQKLGVFNKKSRRLCVPKLSTVCQANSKTEKGNGHSDMPYETVLRSQRWEFNMGKLVNVQRE